MHELALTQNLLATALQHADGKHIIYVNLIIGELSDERPEAIQFYWDDIVRNTPAADAQLCFRRVEAEMECRACGTVFHPEEGTALCPNCGSQLLKLIRGDDVRLESIDVE